MRDDAPISRFRAVFPGIEPCVVARSPGRVNLIGEHIDYNDGVVLPIAIDLATHVIIGRSGDNRLRVRSAAQPDELNYDVNDIPEQPAQSWDAYFRGVAASLSLRGIRFPGCALWVESDIPRGAGLSSSAAFEVAVALALTTAAGISLPMRAIADLCRDAEHRFAGVPCGIMDQYACALARAGHALAIDCRDKSVRHVPWPASNPAVLIVDTGIERRLSSGAYEQRVRECGAAMSAIQAVDPNIRSWRDVTTSHLAKAKPGLSDVLRRRARHVVSEIERTKKAIVAMQAGDVSQFGVLMNASHASLSADYDVSLPAIDKLVERLRGQPGVYGAKLTGAGFGGCVVALVDRAALGLLQSHASGVSQTDQVKKLRSYPVGVAAGAEVVNLSAPPWQS